MASNSEIADEVKNGKTDIDDESNLNHASTPNCALCGCSTPAVRCDKCASQIFCLSCDDMYHRHPKRRLHLRKAVDSIWNSHRSPRLRRHTNLPGDPSKIPIPPPRRKRRERYTISGVGLPKSVFEVPSFSAREPWSQREQNMKSHDLISDSFASDDGSLPPLAKQHRSSLEQKYENSEAILQQNNGVDSKAGGTPDSGLLEQAMTEGQMRHAYTQSPISPSQPLQVDMPDGRTFVPPGPLYSRGNQMSHSAADLRTTPFLPNSPQPFFYPHPHLMHPQMHSYAHAVPHVNCPQCLTGSWSNVMSPQVPPYHQPWNSAQSTLLRRQQETVGAVGDGSLRQRQNSLPDAAAAYPGPHVPFPPVAFPYVGSPFYPPHGYPAAESPLFMDSPRSTDQQRQMLKSPSSTSPRHSPSTDRHDEMDQVTTRKAADEPEEEEEEEEEEEVEEAADTAEAEYKPPEKPSEPWTCLHCTYINPPGSHICEICCKTSYPSPVDETKKPKKKKKKKSEPPSSAPQSTSEKREEAVVEFTADESMQVDSEQPTTTTTSAVDSEKVI